MPIHSDHNLYTGINAHLNSILQNEPGGWRNFQAEYIIQLRLALDISLPEGYFARSEAALQIEEQLSPPSKKSSAATVPDVTVYQATTSRESVGGAEALASPPVMTIPLTDTFTEEDYLTGIVIYQPDEGSLLGRPITRIEVLSPANKPGGSHHEQYVGKREQTLMAGLRLVEIDYLHQSRPAVPRVPSYPDGEKGSFPYVILVSDPRPALANASAYIYGFNVDREMPVVSIPLDGKDSVLLDFGAVYNQTFESSRFFRTVVDYEQEPPRMDTYQNADRERIRQRMAAVRAASKES